MKFYSLILLLGVISHHRTMASDEFTRGNYSGTLYYGYLVQVNGTGDLDLSDLGITMFFPNVFDHLNLKHLDLSNNKITEIPEFLFSNLTNLETLSLAYNKIKLQSGIFAGLENLKILNLTSTGLLTLERSSLFGIPKSAYIIVEGNRLEEIASTSFEPQIPSETDVVVSRSKRSLDDLMGPSDDDINVEVCKTVNGTLKSVAVPIIQRARRDCTSKRHRIWSHKLNLKALRLNKFQFGWWGISGNRFTELDLDNNDISEITAELLNELPESVNLVQIRENKISMIKRNVINNLHIRRLKLESNAISTIEVGAFEKTQLEELYLTSNGLKDVNFARTLPTSIIDLDVAENNITEISEDSFRPLENLRALNLSHNKISHLNEGAFRGLEKLVSIDLSSNGLENIESGTFDNLAKLSSIVLASNKISQIDSQVFRNLTSLNQINLNNNKITRISSNSFGAWKIERYLSLDLSWNKIDIIEEGSFINMSLGVLNLGHNNISEESIVKGAFEGSNLIWLILNNNSITKIDGESFYGISKLRYLILSDNKISSIKKGAAKYLGSLFRLVLSANPLEILENGALYGLSKEIGTQVEFFERFYGQPRLQKNQNASLRGIYAGVFDDV